MTDGRVLVIVPTYNERENIGSLIRELIAQSDRIDVCVADDGSPDGTGAVVREAERELGSRARLYDRGARGGRGAAVIAACRIGLADSRGYRILLEMDADFSHHPRELPKFLAALEEADVVIGSRYVPGGGTSEWGWLRPALSRLANRYVRAVAGMPLRDCTSGYRAYRREVLEAMDFDRIRIRGYAVHGEMAYQAWINGFRLREVPIHFRNRQRDASKLTAREIYMAFLNFGLLRPRYGWRPRRRLPPGP